VAAAGAAPRAVQSEPSKPAAEPAKPSAKPAKDGRSTHEQRKLDGKAKKDAERRRDRANR
jgi:hypothetical protein